MLLSIIPRQYFDIFAVKGISVCKEFRNMLSCYLHLDVREYISAVYLVIDCQKMYWQTKEMDSTYSSYFQPTTKCLIR